MVFELKESTRVEDCKKSDMSIINSLFQAVKVVKKTYLFEMF